MKPHPQLEKFLAPFDDGIKDLTLALREFVTDLVPEANELIWDNYNALALAYAKSEKLKDAFCHISVYAKHVNFGFNRGTQLPKTTIELSGTGKLIRHISVKDFKSFPKKEIKRLVLEAVLLSEQINQDLVGVDSQPKSIVMSVSEKKVRPTSQ